MSFFPKLQKELLVLSLIWVFGFLYTFFIHKFRLQDAQPRHILLPGEYIFHELPKKGLLWILAGVLITLAMVMLKLPKALAEVSVQWITGEKSVLILLLTVGFVTIFATELMSNSVIQIAMFVTLFPITKVCPEISWQVMLVISLCSSCAFMSPIATPSNGLGFGSTRRISIPYMLRAGLFMNIATLGLITLWVHFVVPWVLAFFA